MKKAKEQANTRSQNECLLIKMGDDNDGTSGQRHHLMDQFVNIN